MTLVERLADVADWLDAAQQPSDAQSVREAADRIEVLERRNVDLWNALSVARRELSKWYEGEFDDVLPRPQLDRLLASSNTALGQVKDAE